MAPVGGPDKYLERKYGTQELHQLVSFDCCVEADTVQSI